MLKLNVGFNRKTGEPNYGSRGASVNLELDLDINLVKQPERLRKRVRQLFDMARLSVEEELRGGNGAPKPPDNAAAECHQNGKAAAPRQETRRATANQVRALRAIAGRQEIDLAALLSERFNLVDPAALSLAAASQLIDELNGEPLAAGGQR